MKRPALSRTSELDKIKTELFELMASAQEKTVDEIRAAAEGAASEATILDLGMTSAMGIALKGRVLRQMEAELTTFQLLKQPLQEVIEAIGACSVAHFLAVNFACAQLRTGAACSLVCGRYCTPRIGRSNDPRASSES